MTDLVVSVVVTLMAIDDMTVAAYLILLQVKAIKSIV